MVNRSFISIALIIVTVLVEYSVDYVNKHARIVPVVFDFLPATTPIIRITDPRVVQLDERIDAVTTLNDSLGSESFAEDKETGDVFSGTADGKLQRLRFSWALRFAIDAEITDLLRANHSDVGNGDICLTPSGEQSCGRFLGMKVWRPEGQNYASLIACEGTRGLVQIDRVNDDDYHHEIEELVSNVKTNDGMLDPIAFCNSVAILPDNSAVYFTDSSRRARHDFIYDVLDGELNGRLLKYDVKERTATIVKDNLAFANGVTMTNEGDALLVNEMMRAIIWKYQLKGPNAGTWSLFCVLPFLPDNIQQSPDGSAYLVGGFAWLHPLFKSLISRRVFLRKALSLFSPEQLTTMLSRIFSRGSGVVAVVQNNGHIAHIIDGARAGAKKTSEGFETSNGFFLWGSFDYGVSLIAARSFHLVTQHEVQSLHKAVPPNISEEVMEHDIVKEIEVDQNIVNLD